MNNLIARVRRINVGSVLGVAAALYIGIYLIQTVQHNYQLQQQMSQLQAQIATLQTQQQTLKYQIQYYQTDNYKEEIAREKLGLQDPGEKVIFLPGSSDNSSVPPPPATAKPAVHKSNFQQWLDFLTGRS
jgi:cell division protein DivIC